MKDRQINDCRGIVDHPDPNDQPSGWIRAAKTIVILVVLVGLAWATKSALQDWRAAESKIETEIQRLDRSIRQAEQPDQREALRAQRTRLDRSRPVIGNLHWRWIALSFLLYALALLPPALVLHAGLRAMGNPSRLGVAMAAQILGHVGKYVPGKAMVVVLRTGVLSKRGADVAVATVCVFLETFLMMAVGATVAGLIIGWLPVPRWMTVMAVLAAIGAGAPTLPPVLRLVVKRVANQRVDTQQFRAGRLFLLGWVYSLAGWALMGGAFAALIQAIPSPDPLPTPWMLYAIATAAISLAMVAGFASLIPGGVGVRELVLATILGVSIGPTHGLLAAIAARITFIVVETALGAFAWWWLRRSHPDVTRPSEVAET